MKMRSPFLSPAAALLVLLAVSGSVAHAQYTAVDLYAVHSPVGLSYPSTYGGFAGQSVGNAGVPNVPDVTTHAVLWNQDGSAVDLNPAGVAASTAYGSDGVHQFGAVAFSTGGLDPSHPVVWKGSAASATFLDETGLFSSTVWASGGGRYVGSGLTLADGFLREHALMWNGLTGGTVIDLNPTNLVAFNGGAQALGTSGTQQVGRGIIAIDADQNAHALLWTGSADSAVDLNPTDLPGFISSSAFGTDGHQQVGSGSDSAHGHALLWSGTADSAVDLHPIGFPDSQATAVLNGKQVGYGFGADDGVHAIRNALVWSGTADSVINLNQFLTDPSTYSLAYSLDAAGDIFGIAYNTADQQYHAIEWIPQGVVPEPVSLSLLALCGLCVRRRLPTRTLSGVGPWSNCLRDAAANCQELGE